MRPFTYLLTVLLLAPLAGCSSLGSSSEESAQDPTRSAQQQALLPPEPGLTPRERYRKSLALLEVGEANRAKSELLAYLSAEPGGRYGNRSRDLLRQIDADPEEMLGKEHFLYEMQAGDSLSTVAKQYLGDPLKFYILARYNDLENPSQIKVGQAIKVPGEERPATVQQAAQPTPSEPPEKPADEVESDREPLEGPTEAEASDTPIETGSMAEQPAEGSQDAAPEDQLGEPAETTSGEPTAEPPIGEVPDETATLPPEAGETQTAEAEVGRIQVAILKAEELAAQGDYQAAAREYEAALGQVPDSVMMKQLAAANYITYSDQLMGRGRLDDATTVLARAAELDPESAEVEQRLAALERRRKANELYAEGKKYLAADKPVEAFETFDAVVKMDPDHPAVVDRANLAPVAVEEYHRKAMIFFRRQDLDAALGVWDTKVLVIDPRYEPALLYRAQAIELKERLSDIPNEQPAER